MDLSIQKLSKSYHQKVLFHDLSFEIPSGSRFAIAGANGTGKSTLLKILSGGLLPSSGDIRYTHQAQIVPDDQVYKYLHFVAPYNTVIEELTLPELFHMHQRLGLLKEWSGYKTWQDRLQYPFHPGRQMKTYSSGMKQRVKLGLALLDSRPLILLDEPGSNLDAQGKEWMSGLIAGLPAHHTIVIASNEPSEIALCRDQITMSHPVDQQIRK